MSGVPPEPETDRSPVSYSPDEPIREQAQDRFNRWPFAQRVAETISRRQDPSSLVIAIYGVWGDGKTSTLHLMQEALRPHAHIVQLSFNPWHFESEAQLLRGFFATLADALGRSLPTKIEELGRVLERYGSILSVASFGWGPAQINPGTGLRELGQTLSTVELGELRGRLERILTEASKRVVVFIDDIDRLDRREVQALFKLVKLSAGFERVAYVLAFDDEMVADALGEKYGRGGTQAGRSFLEKIVQVPLRLPAVGELPLRKFAFEGVEAALKLAGIELPEPQVHAFVRYFVDGLEPALATPRQAKRYANALAFALPILKGEVHPVDQMLIEGIRVFYPELYLVIRDNPELFLRAGRERTGNPAKARAREVIDAALARTAAPDKEVIRRRLLEMLFPRLKGVYDNTTYGDEWDRTWEREQRVCSEQYFQRYFHYGVPADDVSDQAVTSLLDMAAAGGNDQLDTALRAFAARGALKTLIPKLRRREETLDATAGRCLALAVARNGGHLPREKGMLSLDWTFMQAAILVSSSLRRVGAGTGREDLAREVMRTAEPPAFALECLRWLRKGEKDLESERLLPEAIETELGQILAECIRAGAQEQPPYRLYRDDSPGLLWLWNEYGPSKEVGGYLRERFERNPQEVFEFLLSYVGTSWGLESGLPHKSDFSRENYNAIARLIDPAILLSALRARYGTELDGPEYHHADEIPIDKRVAHQFVYIHLKVREETQHTPVVEKAAEP